MGLSPSPTTTSNASTPAANSAASSSENDADNSSGARAGGATAPPETEKNGDSKVFAKIDEDKQLEFDLCIIRKPVGAYTSDVYDYCHTIIIDETKVRRGHNLLFSYTTIHHRLDIMHHAPSFENVHPPHDLNL